MMQPESLCTYDDDGPNDTLNTDEEPAAQFHVLSFPLSQFFKNQLLVQRYPWVIAYPLPSR